LISRVIVIEKERLQVLLGSLFQSMACCGKYLRIDSRGVRAAANKGTR
jgi:hypothetical protein